MASAMKGVVTSSSGIIKNILSLNYTRVDVVKEYLNNVLSKNEGNPEYEIEINFKQFSIKKYKKGFTCFDFVEIPSGNPRGFDDFEDLEKAYRIADSDRSGTNNMGYGIYSPITLGKDCISVNLFIQDLVDRSFISFAVYNGDMSDPQIFTEQFLLDEIKRSFPNISSIIVPKGTRNIWFIFPDIKNMDFNKPVVDTLLPFIVESYIESCQEDPKISKSIPKTIGKHYFDYIDEESGHPIKIKYNGEIVSGKDVLKPVKPGSKKSITFDLLSTPNTFYIKKEEDTEWTNLLKTYRGGLSKTTVRVNHSENAQHAKLTICDVNVRTNEDGKKAGQKQVDKKIWVKVGKTYIFCVDFPGWIATNSVRAVLEFSTVEENNFDNFITPNANKSQSMLSRDLVERISALVKLTDRTGFTMEAVPNKRKETVMEKRKKVWETTRIFGPRGDEYGKGYYTCKCQNCPKEVNVFDFVIVEQGMGCDPKICCVDCK
tara:strand:+ start:62 stop:1522 length:1461 start_codon:yes stop_codon:yes gene_type:complete